MTKKDFLTKVLALAGTVLVWLPILSPVFFSGIRLIERRRFLFDYLMPAEFFPVAMVGSILLLWAAFRARSRGKIISWSLVFAVVMLVGGSAFAVVTGLASGETEASGWKWALVLASIGFYTLAMVFIGIGGVLLVRDLFRTD